MTSPEPFNRLILASSSPRRKKILDQLGLFCQVIPSGVEESVDPSLAPSDMVTALSEKKATAVSRQNPEALIIAADTLVTLNGVVLGQPEDNDHAREMLRQLSGQTHDVYTGVTLIKTDRESSITALDSFSERTKVTFIPLTEEEITAYVQSGSPLDKAGAYGIQDDWGAVFVSGIEGDYYNVVGFPVHRFYQQMKAFAPECLEKMMTS